MEKSDLFVIDCHHHHHHRAILLSSAAGKTQSKGLLKYDESKQRDQKYSVAIHSLIYFHLT